jgi:hypothetical protein
MDIKNPYNQKPNRRYKMKLTYETTRGNIKTVTGLVEHITRRGTKYYTKDDLIFHIGITVEVKNVLSLHPRLTGHTVSLEA